MFMSASIVTRKFAATPMGTMLPYPIVAKVSTLKKMLYKTAHPQNFRSSIEAHLDCKEDRLPRKAR
jgi:hypothetical protein